MAREDPLTSWEREEFEADLISFCERELDLLGDIRGQSVLYAGGTSMLWIEGLSQRIGEGGSLTALEVDADEVRYARERLPEADLASPARLVAGSVFAPPFEVDTFDLVYSAGLFHELDVTEGTVENALAALVRVTRAGGRVASTDFVDYIPAAQVEDERLQDDLAREAFGREHFGIGPPERLVALHEAFLEDVRRSLSPPFTIRHLEKVVLAAREMDAWCLLPSDRRGWFRSRRTALHDRIRREGYTRPATLYLEGRVAARGCCPDGRGLDKGTGKI